jgi:hypothetical protein
MNLLSIDVGIKNLAYCLLHVVDDNFTITKWDIIDLCESENFKCLEKTKKGETCNNIASYTKNDINYCKTHAKQAKSYKILPKNIQKMKLEELLKVAKDYNIDVPKKILKTDLIELLQKDSLEEIKKKKAETFNLVELGKSMEKQFKLFDQLQIDIIIIENQISPIANKMKTIQGMIMQSFIIKGIPNIYFISACNKLKYFTDNNSKTSYNERKKQGIVVSRKLLEKHQLCNWIDLFNNHSKKDDLADSFLQGMWYLIHNKYILNNADYLKL